MKKFLNSIGMLLLLFFTACSSVYAYTDDNTEEYKCDLMMRGYEFSNNGLSEAIIKNDKEAISLFIKANINVNLTDNEGFSALDRALNSDFKEAATLISMAGGQSKKENTKKEDKNKIQKPEIDIKKTSTEEVEKDNDDSNKIETNALCKAVNSNNLDLTAKIAPTSPYLNSLTEEGLAPVHYAVFNNNPAMLHVLLNAGADVNILTDDGLTPLDIAVLNYQKNIAKELLENGGALSTNVAKELIKFGCKAQYDEDFGLYDAEFDDIFETMDKIKAKIEQK